MMQFTTHAYRRFQTRRVELALGPPGSEAARRDAQESYLLGQLITRQEAMERIRGPIRPRFNGYDYIYRTDGTGPGVWIARISRGRRCEMVLTYLAPEWVERRLQLRRMFRSRLVRMLPPPVARSRAPQIPDTSAQIAATSLHVAAPVRRRVFTVSACRRRFIYKA